MAALKLNTKFGQRAMRFAWWRSYKVRGNRVRRGLRGFALILLCATVLCGFFPETAFACPTCKEGLANGHDGVSLGYYWSILFMMATPFLIFATWAFFIWRALRKQPLTVREPVLES